MDIKKDAHGLWVRTGSRATTQSTKSPATPRPIIAPAKKIEGLLKSQDIAQLPSESKLIMDAIATLAELRGTSYAKIEQLVLQNYHFKLNFESICRLVRRGLVLQTHGSETSKAYKLVEKPEKPPNKSRHDHGSSESSPWNIYQGNHEILHY